MNLSHTPDEPGSLEVMIQHVAPLYCLGDSLVAQNAKLNVQPEASDAILDASEKVAAIYAELLHAGMSHDSVGRAMIGATVHLYDTLGRIDHLPAIFRRAANNIEIEFLSSGSPKH